MMKFKIILLATFFCCLSVFANELPDLGDSSQLIISAKEEQAIAKAILKEVAVSPEICFCNAWRSNWRSYRLNFGFK
jgi:beta-barrel assembly-enhancing protease